MTIQEKIRLICQHFGIDEPASLSLDWLHECEKKLTGQQIVDYTRALIEITGSTPEPWMRGSLVLHGTACLNFACATKEQRLSALVEALGLGKGRE